MAAADDEAANDMAEERRAWIALASVRGVGDETFGTLVTVFGHARGALAAARDGRLAAWVVERRRMDGRPPINGPVLASILETADDPDRSLTEIAALGLWTITPLDHGYPARLRDLDPPPFVINGLGDPGALRRPRQVALVGTRGPTAAGRALASRICARLVECHAVVVSGLAIGIDGAAHAATVDRGGTTVAVIGAGHRSPGPRAHDRLRRDIVDTGGAVISEHAPAATATRGTFPRRNRLIAALGDATIVVEAPVRSGARITARLALELGRHVLVAPGRVGDWATAGSLALLRETPARPIVGLDELVEDLGYLDPEPRTSPQAPASGAHASPDVALAMLGQAEQLVARRLINGPAGLDALVADTGLPPAVTSSAVTLLLMRGWAQAVGPAYMASGPLVR